MAAKRILIYPDPILRKKTRLVIPEMEMEKILEAAKDMEDSLEESEREGAALAANQIGLDMRMFVTNQSITSKSNDAIVRSIPPLIINPNIIDCKGPEEYLPEGCLSFPGISMNVKRWRHIVTTFSFIEKDGKIKTAEMELSGFWAQVFQHEIDHLEGRLFVDALPKKNRLEIVKKIQQRRR